MNPKFTFQNNNSDGENPQKKTEIKVNSFSGDVVGRVTLDLGTGENAKHSIIWLTIKFCFWIALAITGVLFIFLGIAAYHKNVGEMKETRDFILSIWAIFTPIVTLSLGYAFGRHIDSKPSE